MSSLPLRPVWGGVRGPPLVSAWFLTTLLLVQLCTDLATGQAGEHGGHQHVDSHPVTTVRPLAPPHAGSDQASPADHPLDHQTGPSPSGPHGQMYFFVSTNSTILFLHWTTSSWETLLLACLGIFVTAVFYEALAVLEAHVSSASVACRRKAKCRGSVRAGVEQGVCARCRGAVRAGVGLHFLSTSVHVLRVLLSYTLMLVFMTFNAWLCLAVVAGAGVGYLSANWRRATACPPPGLPPLGGDLGDKEGEELEPVGGSKMDLCH